MQVRVECHSGHQHDPQPIKFWLHDAVHFVERIDDQWSGQGAQYFRVEADDGNTYVLCCDEMTQEWRLQSFRPHASVKQSDTNE